MTVSLENNSNFAVFPLRFFDVGAPECSPYLKLYQEKVNVIRVHPLARQPSPYPQHITKIKNSLHFAQIQGLEKFIQPCVIEIRNAEEALAISQDHKHVLLQQVPKACGPTCVAMLALDRGENLKEWDQLFKVELHDTDAMVRLILNAGFVPIVHFLDEQGSTEEKAKFLADRLQKNGDGILGIDHPVWKGHYICLSSVSVQENLAVVRDPAEGRMLSLPLDDVLEWSIRGSDFIQFGERISLTTFQQAYRTVEQEIKTFESQLTQTLSSTLSDVDREALLQRLRDLATSNSYVMYQLRYLQNKSPDDLFLKKQDQHLRNFQKLLERLADKLSEKQEQPSENLGEKQEQLSENLGKEQEQHPSLGLYRLSEQLIDKLFHQLGW